MIPALTRDRVKDHAENTDTGSPGPAGTHEPWLDRWSHMFAAPPQRTLDIGCGQGGDTQTLVGWGFDVTAIDASAEAIATSRSMNPGATHHVMDIRELPGPLTSGFGIIAASLSLHYLDESETRRAFGAIRELLLPGGVFAFRVNAEDDVNYGAQRDHESWALVDHKGVAKQFFTRRKILGLLHDWAEVTSLEKRTTDRFGPTKSFYETISRAHPGIQQAGGL